MSNFRFFERLGLAIQSYWPHWAGIALRSRSFVFGWFKVMW
jgi:hypothetical protein